MVNAICKRAKCSAQVIAIGTDECYIELMCVTV